MSGLPFLVLSLQDYGCSQGKASLVQERLNVLLRFVKTESRKGKLQETVKAKVSQWLTFLSCFFMSTPVGPLCVFLEIPKLRHLFQLNGSHQYFLNTGLGLQGYPGNHA